MADNPKVDALMRLAKAKSMMSNPIKDTTADVKKYKYNYATLAQVNEIVDPALEANSLMCQQSANGTTLYTDVYDLKSGEIIAQDKRAFMEQGDEQAKGSSQTYQSRYAKLLVFGLAPIDDDGQEACADERRKVITELATMSAMCQSLGISKEEQKKWTHDRFGGRTADQLTLDELKEAAAHFRLEANRIQGDDWKDE